MAESRNLNSGFLDTSFVDFDFTVAKIITILPTGYRAQLLYASYCYDRGEPTRLPRPTSVAGTVRTTCARRRFVGVVIGNSVRCGGRFHFCTDSAAFTGPYTATLVYTSLRPLSGQVPLQQTSKLLKLAVIYR